MHLAVEFIFISLLSNELEHLSSLVNFIYFSFFVNGIISVGSVMKK